MINLQRTYPEGTELTDGFHLIMDALEANGIENLYGLLGIPVTELGRMWQARGHKFYSFRNEQNAGYAASVAGYLTGKPGVCVTVSAPGFLNGLTALANATTNCFPMILISGSSEREIVDLQQGDYEEMDQLAIARPHCKAAFRVNRPEDIGVAFARAVRAAVSGRPGGVYLDIPAVIFPSILSDEEGKASMFAPIDPSPAQLPGPDAIARAIDVIKNAERPLVLLGKGAAYSQADEEIKALIEEAGIPFTPMSMAKGILPDTHELCGGAARSLVLQQSDAVVLIGARLNWLLAHGKGRTWGNMLKKFVHIDIDACEMDSNVPIAAPLVGDIKSTVNALREGLKGFRAPEAWATQVKEKAQGNRVKLRAKFEEKSEMMNYMNSLGAIRDVLVDYPEINLVNEGANALDKCRMVVDQYKPRRRVDTGTWGVMGIGMGSAVACAVEQGPTVAICGDSAFGFAGFELETVTRYNLPVTVVVMNNGGIYRGDDQNQGSDQVPCTIFHPETRYDKFIESIGGTGYRVTTPEELASTLKECIESGKPCLIDAIIDPEAGVESGNIGDLNMVSTLTGKIR